MTAHDFAKALRIALLCAARDPSRYLLWGVNFTKKYVESSDGYRAVRVALPKDFEHPTGFVERFAVRRYLGWLKQEPNQYGDGYKFPSPEFLPRNEKAEFPDLNVIWKTFAKREAPTKKITYSAPLLRTLSTIAHIISPNISMPSVSMEIGGRTEPSLFTIHDATFGAIEYLLMPQRPGPDEMAPGFDCSACGHKHTGEQWAFICVGCTCEHRAAPPPPPPAAPELVAPGAGVTDRG